ncbi:MAG: hypothetical protein R6U68_08935, partial [Desulfobacteraceae bacterium]
MPGQNLKDVGSGQAKTKKAPVLMATEAKPESKAFGKRFTSSMSFYQRPYKWGSEEGIEKIELLIQDFF